jgi:hypothetical protein
MIHPPQFYLVGIQFRMLDEWNPFFIFQIICLFFFSSDFSWGSDVLNPQYKNLGCMKNLFLKLELHCFLDLETN